MNYARLMATPLSQIAATLAQCTPLFFALSENPRQQILLLLVEHEWLNVGQITERIPLSRPAVSHHLKILRQAGLIQVQTLGTEHRYSLCDESAIALLERFVTEVKDCEPPPS